MTDKTTEPNAAPASAADETTVTAVSPELTETDLDKAAGGLWPYVLSMSSYNKTI